VREAHDAIYAWAASNGRRFAGQSWQVCGRWSQNAPELETTIFYLLERAECMSVHAVFDTP
jgi:hypothetical protein